MVVKRQEEGVNGICQNQLFASNLENTVAPESWAKISSTLGSGCFSLDTPIKRFQIHTCVLLIFFVLPPFSHTIERAHSHER